MSILKDNLQEIKTQKDTYLLPENIKKGITVLGVTGTYESIANVKQFNSISEMNNNTKVNENDLAVVYRNEITNMTSSSVISSITFPEQVVLSEAVTDNAYCRLRAQDSSTMFDGNIMLDENRFRFDSFTDSGSIRVQYSSENGITYNRTRFEGNSGNLENPVDLGTNVIIENETEWSNAMGQFMLVGSNVFDGLFQYSKVNTDNQLTLNPLSLNISDTTINLIQAGPILNYEILKSAAKYLSQFYNSDEFQFDAYIDYENKVHIIYAKSGYNSLGRIFIINKSNPVIYMGTSGSTFAAHFDAIYDDVRQTFKNEQSVAFTTMFKNVSSSGFNCIKINGYPICPIGIKCNNYDKWRHFNSTIYYLDTIDSNTNINITDSKLKLNEMVTKYIIAPTQFTANADNLYNSIAYGKNGTINGNITTNVSNSFADINAEIYSKIQQAYDNMKPKVITDDGVANGIIDKNIYFIPVNANGELLLDTSNVTNMSSMFNQCTNLTTIPLLDTSNVTNMSSMFITCTNLTTIPTLDTSKVTNMSNMFVDCNNLTNIPALNTSKVTSMYSMFIRCTNLTTIPTLDTSSVTNMSYMFSDCTNLTTVPTLNTSKATDMSYMFSGCTNLTTIPTLDTSSVTSVSSICQMFLNCESLTDTSLNNILQMCANITIQSSNKTLKYIGLTEEQATKCTTLDNYTAFTNAGWTTGY